MTRAYRRPWILAVLVCAVEVGSAQVSVFPYVERFDSVSVPNLPAGWTSTGFWTIASAPNSAPNAVVDTGNQIAKHLTSPAFNCSNRIPDSLFFSERRTTAALPYTLLVRASTDGITFPITLAVFDTIASANTYVQRRVSLAGYGLSNQPLVKIRWQFLGEELNNTGIVRIDDVRLTVQTTRDVQLLRLRIDPPAPTSGDSLVLSATIKNNAIQSAAGFVVDFYVDGNANSFPDAAEKFSTVSGGALAPGDSTVLSAGHSKLNAGDHKFFAVVNLPNDENRQNDTLAVTLSVGAARNALTVNELMYAPDPAGDEPEWIELFNPSTTDTVNVKNWRVSDLGVSTKTLITTSDAFIPPHGFAVIAKDANFVLIHPNISSPVFLVSFSALNNTTPDAVVLYDQRLSTIDSAYYQPAWGGASGKSIERIDTDIPGTVAQNWGTSQDGAGGTPGRPNSIVRLPYDLVLDSLMSEPVLYESSPVPRIHAWLSNLGKLAVSDYAVAFSADTNSNGFADEGELKQRVYSSTVLARGGSTDMTFDFIGIPSGSTSVIALVECSSDQRQSNNTRSIAVRNRFPERSLLVNEILYEPLAGQNEWLEFYNPTNDPVDVAGWKFTDRPTLSGSVNAFTISQHSHAVDPHGFLVVAADSSILVQFPTLSSNSDLIILNRAGGFILNSDGDAVTLQDLTGSTIDSVAYSPLWHNPDVVDTRGRSLERISVSGASNDRRNWSTAVAAAGGTPGAPNSIYTPSRNSSSSLACSPNPFSPDADGFEDFCTIHYSLPFTSSTVHVKVFDIRGRVVRTLANAELVGASGEIVWDGMDDAQNRVRVGVYIVFLEASEGSTGATAAAKTVVVVARR